MSEQQTPAACDSRGLKVVNNLDNGPHSAAAFQSQINFLTRRFALPPARAAIIAGHAFSTTEARS